MDIEEAFALAATGDADAIYRLGQIHHLGEEVEQDIEKAIAYLEQADELDHPLAPWSLGLFYYNGQFIEKNHSKTLYYWSKSADLGYAPAALQAGLLLKNKNIDQSILTEVNLYNTGIFLLANVASNHLVSGEESGRYANGHPNIVPYNLFKTGKGEIAISVGNDNQFKKDRKIN